MKMEPPRHASSHIKEIGYDGATNTMRVRFASGGLYEYSDIAPMEHYTFHTSVSPGKHFHLIGSRWKGRKIDE